MPLRKTSLTATLMIMMNGMIFTHSASIKGVDERLRTFPSHLRHQTPFYTRYNYYQYSATENAKTSNMTQKKLISNLILKLRKVIDGYKQNKEDLKKLYSEIAYCELNKCGKLSGLFPENKNLKNFKCFKFKKLKKLEKHISLFLTNFSEGVQNSVKGYQKLIRLNKQDGSRGRIRILNELKNQMKTLKYEIDDARNSLNHKRLNFTRQLRIPAAKLLPNPQTPTDLMIVEWLLIQQSEAFLKEWRRNFPKVFKCWKYLQKQEF